MSGWLSQAVRHVRTHVDTWLHMARATVHVPAVLALHRFDKPADLLEWHTTTDQVVGGA